MSIEKTIHYCWFGNGKKSELMNKCIKSWREKLPEYKIVEWNEHNFDINICPYVKEAYDARKYAFVSDFARFYILYNYGGIYMDTDVEVLKSLDNLLDNHAFAGFESKEGVNPGLIIASEKKNEIIGEILNTYLNRKFIMNDGSYNTTTVVKYTTDTLKKYGLKCNNKLQNIQNMVIYPKTYFCPLKSESNKTDFSENTYTIHHFAATWLSDDEKKRNNSLAWKILKPILVSIKKVLITVLGEDRFENIKVTIRRNIKCLAK